MNPAVQAASAAAWSDEAHVQENRAQYRAKFAQVTPIIQQVLRTEMPDAAFYLWCKTPHADDAAYAKALLAHTGVTVLPGSFLARDTKEGNPGQGHIRIALVDTLDLCVEAAKRIAAFTPDFLSTASFNKALELQ